MNRIYLDYAATTPVDPAVIEAMMPYCYEKFGNASSPHGVGQEALSALEDSRSTIAQFIGATPNDIIFNSGATEGNNHAISGVVYKTMEKGGHLVVSTIEHHSVAEPIEHLINDGFDATYVTSDENGIIDPLKIQEAIQDDTILIAVLHASNEIGTIQPIAEIGEIAKVKGIPFLVDACQTVGHISIDVDKLNVDLLSFSAHKFYGPKGVGALYIRPGTAISTFLFGGDQERGQRASTQNVAGVVGMAKAVELCKEQMEKEEEIQIGFRKQLMIEIPKRVAGVQINGHVTDRLANNAHFSFEGINSQQLLISMDMKGIAASMGSACTSGSMEPSHVLKAIGLSDELANGALRLTVGRWTTQSQIDQLLEVLPDIVERLRK